MATPNLTRTGSQGQTLALLYQEFITAVVRVQGGVRNIDSVAFREAATRSVREAEQSASSLGYEPADIQKASLAVVALLDEVALASNAFDRTEWARMPLALQLYQEPRAGQVVLNQLEECLRGPANSPQSADLLEVYLLCLLLGFEGRYAGRRGELHELIEKARARIEMNRPRISRLTPDVDVPAQLPEAPPPQPVSNRWLVLVGAFVAGALLLFVVLKIHLWWISRNVAQTFAER